ncbi:hypothetical protein FRC01_009348, partial [Tulasnella sp. 417]
DRFTISERAIGLIATRKPNGPIASRAAELQAWYLHQNRLQERYVLENGADSEEVSAPVV